MNTLTRSIEGALQISMESVKHYSLRQCRVLQLSTLTTHFIGFQTTCRAHQFWLKCRMEVSKPHACTFSTVQYKPLLGARWACHLERHGDMKRYLRAWEPSRRNLCNKLASRRQSFLKFPLCYVILRYVIPPSDTRIFRAFPGNFVYCHICNTIPQLVTIPCSISG